MYKEKIIDAVTGEETSRNYSEAEIAEVKAAQIKANEQIAEAEARATARASALVKLEALGLSADEIASL